MNGGFKDRCSGTGLLLLLIRVLTIFKNRRPVENLPFHPDDLSRRHGKIFRMKIRLHNCNLAQTWTIDSSWYILLYSDKVACVDRLDGSDDNKTSVDWEGWNYQENFDVSSEGPSLGERQSICVINTALRPIFTLDNFCLELSHATCLQLELYWRVNQKTQLAYVSRHSTTRIVHSCMWLF
jgi:hypothetical protein